MARRKKLTRTEAPVPEPEVAPKEVTQPEPDDAPERLPVGKARIQCPFCAKKFDVEVSEDVVTVHITATQKMTCPPTRDSYPCPNCSQMIPRGAIVID